MSVPKIGAVVVDVATSRSPDGPNYIKFNDGTVMEVPKEKVMRMVRGGTKLTFAEYANADHLERKQIDEEEAKRIAGNPLWDEFKGK